MSDLRGRGLASRRDGFTLIELLVVIAIIGILAAMLFPVFARARESARKTQCLANVKNIAMGMQIYLTDYDRLPPNEHRQEAIDYFTTQPGGTNCSNPGPAQYAWRANPYLRWPVILDEYIKSREVWKCPSAKLTTGATYILPGPDYLGYLQQTAGQWGGGMGFGPCVICWPPGWGGAVTDSAVQQLLASANTPLSSASGAKSESANAFVQSIGYNGTAIEYSTSQIENPSSFVVCQDAGGVSDAGSPGLAAYPDICCAECSGYEKWGGWPPATDCGIGSSDCGACWNLHANLTFFKDPKKELAATRHMGGSNLGFADGHAQWMPARQILAKYGEKTLTGVQQYCPNSSREGYIQYCGEPAASDFFMY
jgi:prepilin-type N-terminal cleavage/methylation domain-containing protein/prepilin-type processing-associated H-X9-DG protein